MNAWPWHRRRRTRGVCALAAVLLPVLLSALSAHAQARAAPWRIQAGASGLWTAPIRDGAARALAPGLDARLGRALSENVTLVLSLRLPLVFAPVGHASAGLGVDVDLWKQSATTGSALFAGQTQSGVERAFFVSGEVGYSALYAENPSDRHDSAWLSGPDARVAVGFRHTWIHPVTRRGIGFVLAVGAEDMYIDDATPARAERTHALFDASVGLSIDL